MKLGNNLYYYTYVVTIVKGEEVSELDKRSQRVELGSFPFVCWESRDPQLRNVTIKASQGTLYWVSPVSPVQLSVGPRRS